MSPLAGTYLDPMLVVHLDEENWQSPIFDGLFKEMVKGGSEVALELQEYLKVQDKKKFEAPEEVTMSFPALDPEYGPVCTHGIPEHADCTYCNEGLAPHEPRPANAYIIASRQGRVYGKTKAQRRRWWKKIWDAIWEVAAE